MNVISKPVGNASVLVNDKGESQLIEEQMRKVFVQSPLKDQVKKKTFKRKANQNGLKVLYARDKHDRLVRVTESNDMKDD